MKHRQSWLKWQGSLLLVFLPYFAGFFLARFFGWGQVLKLQVLFPAALVLILFAGASAYGFLTTLAAFLFLGVYASDSFARMSFASVLNGSSFWEFLVLSPWYPALFGAAYLGLMNTGRLLQTHVPGAGTRLKACLCTSALQCGLFACAALISHMIKI